MRILKSRAAKSPRQLMLHGVFGGALGTVGTFLFFDLAGGDMSIEEQLWAGAIVFALGCLYLYQHRSPDKTRFELKLW